MPDEQEKEQETCFEEENRAWRLHVPSVRNSPINSVRPKGTNIHLFPMKHVVVMWQTRESIDNASEHNGERCPE